MNNKRLNLLTNTNAKIKKTAKLNGVRLYEFNLPALITCPFADSCKVFCYADKGSYKYKVVVEKYAFNLELTKQPEAFQEAIQAELIKKRVEYVRIHSSGDFYSLKYLKIWVNIALNNPEVIFYGYTKSVPLFNSLDLPSNFIFCYSTGGKKDNLIKPGAKKAVIFNSLEELQKAGYTNCSVNDMAMIKADKIGLIYH